MQYTAYVKSMADAIAIAISEAEEATLYKQGEEANVILQAEQVHQAEEESYAELVLNAVTAALEDRDMSYESRLEWQIDRLKGEVAYYDHRPIVAAYLQKAADRLWYELESEQLSDSLEEYFYGGTDTGYYRAQERANKLKDELLERELAEQAAEERAQERAQTDALAEWLVLQGHAWQDVEKVLAPNYVWEFGNAWSGSKITPDTLYVFAWEVPRYEVMKNLRMFMSVHAYNNPLDLPECDSYERLLVTLFVADAMGDRLGGVAHVFPFLKNAYDISEVCRLLTDITYEEFVERFPKRAGF